MVSRRIWNRHFRLHGHRVVLQEIASLPVTYWAIIQPLRYKNKMYLHGAYSDLGYVDPGFYLYIGPGEVALDTLSRDAVITMGERSFVIDRAERVYYGGQAVYCWAVLRSRFEEDADENI